jgi:hypothetical protein
LFIQDKRVSTRITVLFVHIDSSDTSEDYHYYTINLITGSNCQISRDAIMEDRYTANNSALKHDNTDNGIMSLPLWFRHNQKIMVDIDGMYARGYLQLVMNGTSAFVTLDKRGKINTSSPISNLAFDWYDCVNSQMLIFRWQYISHFLLVPRNMYLSLSVNTLVHLLSF